MAPHRMNKMERASASQRLRIVCPDCGHIQSEPNRVVSTICRACSRGIQVKDGTAVTRPQAVIRAGPPKPTQEPPPEIATIKPAASSSFTATPQPKPKSFFSFLNKPKPKRSIACFQCEREHFAVSDAQSSQCPFCGTYLSLRDYLIEERWNRSILTRGNVTISRGAAIEHTTVSCHNLTALGILAAPANCSGDLVIHRDSRIPGPVQCKHLRIERGACVEFLGPVTTDSISVAGEVTGTFTCSGIVTLEKRAQLRGKITAASLVVKAGARHTGTIDIIPPSPDSPSDPPVQDPPP
jgi:cytoskeletal protein CcmA (bactofilin family)/ribosomal protein S27E